MRETVAILYRQTHEQDAKGVWRTIVTPKTVLCKVASITRNEFFNAGLAGMNPEIELIMNAIEYSGETIAEVEGTTYSIYRTYRQANNDDIELYLERKAGTA